MTPTLKDIMDAMGPAIDRSAAKVAFANEVQARFDRGEISFTEAMLLHAKARNEQRRSS